MGPLTLAVQKCQSVERQINGERPFRPLRSLSLSSSPSLLPSLSPSLPLPPSFPLSLALSLPLPPSLSLSLAHSPICDEKEGCILSSIRP